MGYGDALMATAEARVLHEQTGHLVAIGDGQQLKWGASEREIFRGNPRLCTQTDLDRGADVVWLENWSGHRPYIDREAMKIQFWKKYPGAPFTMKRQELPWIWTDWRVRDYGPGELYLTDQERQQGRKLAPAQMFAVFEPSLKSGASPNKAWLWKKFCDVAFRLRMTIVQFNPAIPLPDSVPIRTVSFREAAAVLSHASLYFGCEGGLHHAAAALDVPAVVYHGGYISPETTGYDSGASLFRGPACGMRLECSHCTDIANEISVDEAMSKIEGVLNGTR